MPFGITEVAKNTLLTQQAAMQIIAHNVANAHTEGYVRQVPVMEPIPGPPLGTAQLGAGYGARMAAVKRLQHSFAAAQSDRQLALLGRERATRDMLGQVEAIFSELGGTGLVNNLAAFFSSFEQIGADPTNLAARQETVARAELVADIIAGRHQQLHDLRTVADEHLFDHVREANGLAHQIADLNRKIGEATVDPVINDLKSLRDTAMSRLSELTGAYYIEQPNNQVDVLIGGRRMVQVGEVIELRLQPDPANPGMHRVLLGDVADPEGLGGTLIGLMDARDGQIVEYIERLNLFAQTLADQLNAAHEAGFDLQGAAGLPFFVYSTNSPAGSLRVNPAIAADPALIAAATAPGAVGDGANASAIAQLRDVKMFDGGLFNPTEYFADLIGQMGSDGRAAAVLVSAREAVVESLRANYQALSGVNLDEEAVDLIRYQQVYNAAARLLSVSQAMMDALFAIGR